MDQYQKIWDKYQLVNPIKRIVRRSVDTRGDSHNIFLEQVKSSSSKTGIELDLPVSPIKLVRHKIDSTKVNFIPLFRDIYNPTVEQTSEIQSIIPQKVDGGVLLNPHGGVYINDKHGEPVLVTNGNIQIISEVDVYSSNETYEPYYHLSIRLNNVNHDVMVKKREYWDCADFLRESITGLAVNKRKEFINYLAILAQNPNISKTRQYDEVYGWVRIEDKFIYLHQGIPGCFNSVLPLEVDYSKAQDFLNCFTKSVRNPSYAVILLLYSLGAYIQPLLSEADIPGFRSVLFLVGETQSGKTTLAESLVGCLLEKSKVDITSFQSTFPAIEDVFEKGRDRLILVDDLYPKGKQGVDKEFEEKATNMIRILGDSKLRDKKGPLGKKLPTRHYTGGAIATGEILGLSTLSSYARSLVIELQPGDICKEDSLWTLSRDKTLAKSFYSAFIRWIENKQQGVILWLKESFTELRSTGNDSFASPRLQDSKRIAILLLALFQQFCKDSGLAVGRTISRDALDQYFIKANAFMESHTPMEIFCRALDILISDDKIVIASSEADFRKQDCDGYYDGEFIYLIPTNVFDKIDDYYQGTMDACNRDLIVKDLYKRGLLLDCKRHRYPKDRLVRPKRPYLMKFAIDIIKNDTKEILGGKN